MTLQLKYVFISSEEPDITNMVSRPNIQSIQVKHMRKLNMSEYRHLQMKKADKPDYLPDPDEGTRS